MLSDDEVARIVMMRGLGFDQNEIARELGITQGAVSYNLKRLRKQAEKSGVEAAFIKVLAAGIGIERLKDAGLI